MFPWFRGAGELDSSCHRGGLAVLELDWVERPEGAVAALAKDLQVLKDRISQLEAGPPAVPVQQLDLHPGPEGLDHGIVVADTDATHRGHQSGRLGALAKHP